MAESNYDFQKEIVAEILVKLNSKKRVLAAVNCGLGKTFIGSAVVHNYIKKGKKIVISAYSLNEIKLGWLDKITKYKLIPKKMLQVVTTEPEKYKTKYPGISFVTRSKIDNSKQVTIIIPQSVRAGDLKEIDLFLVDEAHEYLEVEDGKLKDIIDEGSHEETRVVGLSGTGHELLDKKIFSRNDPDVDFVVRDVFYALETKTIIPTEVYLEYFEFPIKKEFYKKDGSLNSKGSKLISNKIFKQLQLTEVIKKCSVDKKTLVIVPRGNDINTSIRNFINSKMGRSCCVLKTSKQESFLNDASEVQFRNNPNIKFMVVVDMCGTGWDFQELDNVIDLTFTKNRKLIIQRMNRPCRFHKGKSPKYFYCTDQTDRSFEAPSIIWECFSLMTEEGILDYTKAKMRQVFDRDLCESIQKSNGRGSFLVGDILKYFQGGKPRVSEHRTIVFNQFKDREGKFPWQHMANSYLVGKLKKDYPKKKLNHIRDYIKDLSKVIPENSDLFLDKVKDALGIP